MRDRSISLTRTARASLAAAALWIVTALFAFASHVYADDAPVILAFGDSLTAGFGVPDHENYPSRLQKMLQEKGYPHRVVNAGVSGDTTAGGARRIHWVLKHNPKIVILALGANDGLRGLPVAEMRANLQSIIDACKEKNARVLLTGMKVPPNYGDTYSREFEAVFARLAKENGLAFMPFLLEGIAAKREYTQPDGIHPEGSGYAVLAANVWDFLEPMLKQSPS